MTMRLKSFRGLVAGMAVAAVAFGAVGAKQATAEELNLAYFMGPGHPMARLVITPWAEAIAEATGGALTFNILPGGQIGGGPPGAFKRVTDGISDVEFGLQGYTSSVFPRTLVTEVPLYHKSPTTITQALWDVLDVHVMEEYANVKIIGIWTTDIPALMTNKPVRVPADLAGLKIRTPSANQSAIIEAFGAVPVAMPVTQLYGNLEKGVVDGAMIGMSTVRSFKLEEVVKYFTVGIPFGSSPQFLVMNRDSYNALPAATRKAIDDLSGLDLSLKATAIYIKSGEDATAGAEENSGLTVIHLTDAEIELWRAALKPVADGWAARFNSADLDFDALLAAYAKAGM